MFLQDNMEYTGAVEAEFAVTVGGLTLNGEPLQVGKFYTIKPGDVIDGLKRGQSGDCTWQFSDEHDEVKG